MKKRPSKNKGILLISFLLFAIVAGLLVFKKYDTATRTVEPPPKTHHAESVVVTLFFASADGAGLAREGREVVVEDGIEGGIESVVEELVSGPIGSLSPTLPANARVLGVRVEGDVAKIDFGRELQEGIPSGSSAEMAAVYSIVDSVAGNFPQIKAVQLLIEGAPVDSLGHLDISAPIAPDLTLEKREPPVVPESK